MVRRTRSLDTVMDLHEVVHAYLLRLGRAYAVQIAQRDGDVDTRRVFAAMAQHEHASKILASMEGSEARHRWLGALIRSCRPQVWIWTGRRAERGSAERGTHSGGEGVKIWCLVAGADLTAFEAPDAVPPPAVPEAPPVDPTPPHAPRAAEGAEAVLARLRWRQRAEPPPESEVRTHMTEGGGLYAVIGEGANVVLTNAADVARLKVRDEFHRSCGMPGWRWLALGSHGEIF